MPAKNEEDIMGKKKITVMVFAVAILVTVGCAFWAAQPEENKGDKKYPVIRIMTMGKEPACTMAPIYEQLDQLTEEELGIDVRISFYAWEDEKDVMYRLVNAGSADIYVYGSPFGSEELARRNAFLDAGEYLSSVPGLVSFYKGYGIDLEGQEHVWSFPRLDIASSYGLLYREDLRREWGLEPVVDMDTVEAYLYRAAEEYAETAPINDSRFFDSLLQLMAGDKYYILGYGVGIPWDEPDHVICLLDTPEYGQALEKAAKWYRDGIVSPDILYLQTNNTMYTLEMMKQDKAVLEFANHFSAVCKNYVMQLYEIGPDWEFGWLDYNIVTKKCFDNYPVSDGTIGLAIGSNCQYPVQAMLLMEKMHTDSRYYNLLMYGCEGLNYNLSDEGRIQYDGIDADNILRGQIGLECDPVSLEVEYPGNWNEVYRDNREQYKQLSRERGNSELINFSLDEADYPYCTEALKRYSDSRIRKQLETGVSQDMEGDLESLRRELTESGYEDFLIEAQRQLDIFYQ